jgi:arylsulfatase A-like enzyme
VVAVTGDHGEEFIEHGDLSHHNDKLFDELLHVPLLVAAPGVPAARRSEAVSLVDLGRTLLDLAGLQQRAFPGRSFAALVTGGEPRGAPFEVVAHGYLAASRGEASARERECLVAGRYKLVRDLVSGALSLYDLETDPGERVDLAGDEPGRTSELAARLDGYLERRGGLGPEPPPEPDEIRRQREGWLAEHAAALKALGY